MSTFNKIVIVFGLEEPQSSHHISGTNTSPGAQIQGVPLSRNSGASEHPFDLEWYPVSWVAEILKFRMVVIFRVKQGKKFLSLKLNAYF